MPYREEQPARGGCERAVTRKLLKLYFASSRSQFPCARVRLSIYPIKTHHSRARDIKSIYYHSTLARAFFLFLIYNIFIAVVVVVVALITLGCAGALKFILYYIIPAAGELLLFVFFLFIGKNFYQQFILIKTMRPQRMQTHIYTRIGIYFVPLFFPLTLFL